jgi:glycerol-3-phosphate acyltransferase PlsY
MMGFMQIGAWIVAMVVAYLCGSVPFGLLIGRARGVDIRLHGSRNIGATNAGRVLGRKFGILCFVLDVLKGFLPVFVVGRVMGLTTGEPPALGEQGWWLAVAVAAMAGHIAPVWLKFKGGKGVATGLGVILGVYPYLTLPGFIVGLVWLLFASTLRYVSLASIVAAGLLPVVFVFVANLRGWTMASLWPMLVVTVLMALLVIVRHRSNMARLIAGTESRLGARKS